MTAALPPSELAASAVAEHCPAIPNATPLLNQARLRWLIVGEQHGTTEDPLEFSNILCLASKTGKRIIVGIEYPDVDQSKIESFLSLKDEGRASDALAQINLWHTKMQDGRGSVAIMRLFHYLRTLKASGAIADVVAFQPTAINGDAEYERAMAGTLEKAAAPAKTMVVALVGNVHARTTNVERGTNEYLPMAGWLPKDQTISINLVADGGAQWACLLSDSSPSCGPKDFGPTGHHYRGITLTPGGNSPYTATFYIDVPTTASSPAISDQIPNREQ